VPSSFLGELLVLPDDTRGLKELQAVCAVMRKLLLTIHAMLRTNSPFDSRRFFSPTETTT